MKNYFALLVLTSLFFISCSNDDDNSSTNTTPTNTTPATKTELITAKPWKYSAWTVNPPVKDNNGNDVSDVLANRPACSQDDLLIFNKNGNVSFDEGPTKCDNTDPQSTQGAWVFTSGEAKMNMANRVYNISTLTETEMVLVFEEIVGSTIHIHTVKFIH